MGIHTMGPCQPTNNHLNLALPRTRFFCIIMRMQVTPLPRSTHMSPRRIRSQIHTHTLCTNTLCTNTLYTLGLLSLSPSLSSLHRSHPHPHLHRHYHHIVIIITSSLSSHRRYHYHRYLYHDLSLWHRCTNHYLTANDPPANNNANSSNHSQSNGSHRGVCHHSTLPHPLINTPHPRTLTHPLITLPQRCVSPQHFTPSSY